MAKRRGRLITFEGIDGSGKTTVAKLLAKQLRSDGANVLLTCEPTRTRLGDVVKSSLRRKSGRPPLDPLAQAHLFMADHCAHIDRIRKVVRSNRAPKFVISDRFSDSMVAYQGVTLAKLLGGQRAAIAWLVAAQKSYDLRPDLTFLIDVPVRVAISRLAGRKTVTDFERPAFLERVRANYKWLSRKNRHYVTINGKNPPDEVASRCVTELKRRRLL